jgi:RecJ-like exonuclease
MLEYNKIYTEECMCCHGSGKRQQFDKKQNKWVKSDLSCDICSGNGKRKFVNNTKTTDFVYNIRYLPNN